VSERKQRSGGIPKDFKMTEKYKINSTSNQSARVEDRELSRTQNTRRILRCDLIDNHKDSAASVKATILHQKSVLKGQFEDISAEPLSKLTAGEIGKLILDSAETKKLYEELRNLFEIHESKGVPSGKKEVVVGYDNEIFQVDAKRAGYIKRLVEQGHSEEVWKELVQADPSLASKLSSARIHEDRKKHLNSFKETLTRTDLKEEYWQHFFEKNIWIFGYGLNYQILKTVSGQPVYGGQTLQGDGANKGDFLNSTQGLAKFTVLVEIKKPQTPLLQNKAYRNDTFSPSEDLSGGVSQLRVNGRTWEVEGSRTDKNRETLKQNGIDTINPKLILVIGNTGQLANQSQKISFELFRRGQNDLEILTFDEIFERAKFIVDHEV
jgi:hypothetical protein